MGVVQMIKNWKIRNKLILYNTSLVCIALLVFLLLEGYVEKVLYKEKEEQLTNILAAVTSTAEYYQSLVAQGKMTESDAKNRLALAYRGIRYGEGKTNYFFIFNYEGIFVMHPDSSLDGTSALAVKDADGIDIGRLFLTAKDEPSKVKFVRYNYKFQNKGYIPKITIVKAYDNWQWIIGTGIPVQELKETIFKLRVAAAIFFSCFLLLAIFTGYFSDQYNYKTYF